MTSTRAVISFINGSLDVREAVVGEGEALGGVIAQDAYCLCGTDGRWMRFSLADGERIV